MRSWEVGSRRLVRRSVVAGLAAVTLVTVAACGAGGTTSKSTSSGTAGTGGGSGSLTVLVEGGGHGELQPVADKYTQETGTKVTFVELPYDGLYDRLNSELSSGNVSFDVAALDAVWLTAFKDGLTPIDDLFNDRVKGDMFPSLLKEAQTGGHFIGMPAWTNAELLFYRTDLFNDTTKKAAFKAKYGYDLVVPTTWQQYLDVAKFFTEDSAAANGGTPKLYGTDVKGKVETEWLAAVLQAGDKNVVLDDSGKVIINDAAHKKALDFYTQLATKDKVTPAGPSQIDWAAAQNLFNQGQLAMTRFWAHAYTQIPKDSPVYGKVGVAPMPAGDGGIGAIPGAWYLSVPKATKNSAEAKKFIQFAYENNALGLSTPLGLAATKSALQSAAAQPGHENLNPLITTLGSAGTQPRPANAKWQQIVDTVLVPMIQKAVDGNGTDNQKLLDDAKKQIEGIVG